MTKRSSLISERDEIISLARVGGITPQKAEAKAAANGWPSFETQPPLPAFDPMQQGRWPIVMAIAWIAFRDLELTRQQCPEFRAECTHWIWREWREPVASGTAFERRAGWFLEGYSKTTVAKLALLDIIRTSQGEVPSRQMSVRAAEAELWKALSEAKLIAVGLNDAGRLVDIPEREWSYLKLFEERDRDTFKYSPMDRQEPYSQVTLKRDDLLGIWPRVAPYLQADERTLWPIEPYMLKPISVEGNVGFVPLCAAIQWIMTDGGARSMLMDDAAWYAAVKKLWPAVCSGDIELIALAAGRAMTEPIPGHTLTLVKVLPPLNTSIGDILLNARSHIACTPFVDQEQWDSHFNDRLYETGRAVAAWSHIQVRKSKILERWPRAGSTASVEQACYRWLVQQMQASPEKRPHSRNEFGADAMKQFAPLAERQFLRAWQKAITDTGAKWSKAGRPKSNRRTS